MLFLKNLLLRNFQGCCLLFNYQGSSLFLLIRSSFDILSRRFPFVKNFFHFLFAVCSGSVSPSQVRFNRLSHPHPSVKNFFHVVQRSALASCPIAALRLSFSSSVCFSDMCYLITLKVNCQCFCVFYFFRTIQTIHFSFYKFVLSFDSRRTAISIPTRPTTCFFKLFQFFFCLRT